MRSAPSCSTQSSPADDLRLIRAGELFRLLGIGDATGWRWKALGKLPTPIDFGGKHGGRTTLRWRLAEIREWIAAGCPEQSEWESRRQPSNN